MMSLLLLVVVVVLVWCCSGQEGKKLHSLLTVFAGALSLAPAKSTQIYAAQTGTGKRSVVDQTAAPLASDWSSCLLPASELGVRSRRQLFQR